ncbi:MAG: hypothetical protein K9N34_05935 [Candidatus Marinimicrobia bacterium]|nr:hypothetical protein [Candidatus Neomarinimicrobiota bacterium]MCF7840112.1 hypothetical protein [Candidatus Neomarinimicrobiota bacterium]MCF7902646.1 hypothetical protein [Candidatus Neomarinimicrobiota bacterium]
MKSPRQPRNSALKIPFHRFQRVVFAVLLFFGLYPAVATAQDSFQITGAFGPAIAVHTISLDKTAFSGLAGLHPDFDLGNTSPALKIKGDLFITAGIEGFTRLSPHWGLGTSMGFGKYQSSVDTDSSRITVLFTLSQFGLVPEFTLNPAHRLKIVLGAALGITPALLSASTIYPAEQWQNIISGTVVRSNYKATAWAPLVQPWLGLDLGLTEFLGLRVVGGYEMQKISRGGWQLENSQSIDDSPAVDFSALFARLLVYTSF